MVKKRPRKDGSTSSEKKEDAAEETATTTEKKGDGRTKRTRPEWDPDGTVDVARNVVSSKKQTAKESDDDPKILLEHLSQDQKKQVGRHLFGSQGDLTLQRRIIQRKEDANPSVSMKKLTDLQKIHLQKRKNTRAHNLLHRLETKRLHAAVHAVQTVDILEKSMDQPGILEPEDEMERTTAVTQTQLKRHHLIDTTTDDGGGGAAAAQNIYD